MRKKETKDNFTKNFQSIRLRVFWGLFVLVAFVWFSSWSIGAAKASSLLADFNSDGVVNIFDYNIFLQNFGNSECGGVCDVNGDCLVNIFDYNLFLQDFGKIAESETASRFYASVEHDDLYSWDSEAESFIVSEPSQLSGLPIGDVAVAPNGDIYVLEAAGNIWKKPAGKADFVEDSPSGNWGGITVAPNGDVYVTRDINGVGDIYKKSSGSSSYLPLGQINLKWNALCADAEGNIYAAVWSFDFSEFGGIYKQTGGAGDFELYSDQIKGMFTGITVATNGDFYVADYGYEVIYKQEGGTGAFFALGEVEGRRYTGAAAAPNGDVLFSARSHWTGPGDGIYIIRSGQTDLVSLGQANRHWNGIAIDPTAGW